jgi:hypothetical protein
MPIVSEIVLKAQADLIRLNTSIVEWTDKYLELLGNVAQTDLVFQEAGALTINFVALCLWDHPSNLVVIHVIRPGQTEESHKRTLAMTSVMAAALYDLGHKHVSVALLADDLGKAFRHEGLAGHCQTIRGCSQAPETPSQMDFSSIPGHSVVCPSVQRFSN